MSTAPRKPAPRLARPAARYWKGKAPKGIDLAAVAGSDSDEDEDLERQQADEDGDVAIRDLDGLGEDEDDEEDELPVGGGKGRGEAKKVGMSVALKDVNISKDGRVIVAGREESGRTQVEQEEESEEESEEEEEETKPAAGSAESSEEESSDEDEPAKPQFRPVFVPKQARVTVNELEVESQETEEAKGKRELEAEERRKQSHDMVAESIRRELLEKETEEQKPDIDDTDGLDPDGEFEAWRMRELARIKRDQEAALAREAEREEVERRRALPEEQRLKEDLQHAEKTRAEKPKGQQKFLQKYHHKGAFFQDLDILKKHDFTEATESTVDISLLPKVMQVKNFGKRSQTKYTHLADQDTSTGGAGAFGGMGPGKSTMGAGAGKAADAGAMGGCYLCGGPHLKRDCPKNVTGANGAAAPMGQRREWGAGTSSWRDGDRTEGGPGDDRTRSGWSGRGGDDTRDRERGGYRDRDRDRPSGQDRDRGERGGQAQGRGGGRDYGRRRSRSRSRSPRERERDRSRERETTRRRYADDDRRAKERRRSRSREEGEVRHGNDKEREDKRRRVKY